VALHQPHLAQPVQPLARLTRLLAGKQLDSDLQRAHHPCNMQPPQDRLVTPHKTLPAQFARTALEDLLEICPQEIDHEQARFPREDHSKRHLR
jgi:hypothetical protein